MLVASHYLTYPSVAPQVGAILGPSLDGETYWMVVSAESVGGKYRVGLYCIDSEEASKEAAEWRVSQL